MAKKQEELIEKTVSLPNSKPNLKISKKAKSAPVTETTSQDTVCVDSISVVQETKNEIKPKRTIRINLNKTKNDKKVEEEKIENIVKTESKKSNKPKRTLKLNLPENNIEPERPKITEISINQNSSFFYTPSVFEKFSINVTDEDEIPEEIIETIPEEHEEINEVEEEIINESEMYDFESNDVFDINSITITPIEDIIEELPEDSQTDDSNEIVEEINEESLSIDDLLLDDSLDLLDQIDGLDEVIEEIVSEELTEDEVVENDLPIDDEISEDSSDLLDQIDELDEVVEEIVSKELTEDEIIENNLPIDDEISEDSIDLLDQIDELDEVVEETISEELTEDEIIENNLPIDEEISEDSTDLLDQIDELDEVVEEIVSEELIEDEIVENNLPIGDEISEDSIDLLDQIDELDEVVEETISEELTEDEVVENDLLIDEDLEQDDDADITEEDIENFLKDDEDDSYVFEGIKKVEETIVENSIEEPIIEENILSNESVLETLSLDDSSISNEDEENLLIEALDEEILAEAADNMDILENIEEQASSKKENLIGKFFDSSIPSMVETGGEYFSKIKKSIFSNMSNVFKKFSYDEAELVKAANAEYEESINVEVKEPSVSDIVQNFENAIGTEFSLNNMDVTVEPVATITTPVIDEALLSPTSDTLDSGLDNLYSSIITPDSNTKTESVNIDDELLEEALLNDFSFEDLEELSDEESTETEIDSEPLEIEEEQEEAEEDFNIEDYFGLNDKKEEEKIEEVEEIIEEAVEETVEEDLSTEIEENFDAEEFETAFLNANDTSNATPEELISQVSQNMNPQDLSSLSQLLTTFNQTITTLSDRIASLESGNNNTKSDIETEEEINVDDIDLDDLDLSDVDLNSIGNDTGLEFNDNGVEDVEEPSILDDFNAFKFEDLADEISLEDIESVTTETETDISDILSKTFLEDNSLINDEMKKELLSEVLSVENETDTLNINDEDPTSDFFKIIDSLSKTISELEKAPDVAPKALSNLPVANPEDGKAINILINKDDIFSISILNETYEIVADFDGISVLSENIHISTPKHNFFVQVGEKYIEIHNKGPYFSLDTSFEDIEFANAINNVSFAKKNNKIELIIKDAFKLSSVNNKVELSMLNTVVADLAKTTANNITNAIAPEEIDETSVCDSRTLLISEETQKVYLPYTIDEVMKKLNSNSEYQTVEEVVENEYTLPLSTFKMPIISRFKEAYRFMRVKEKSSVYAALDLALELMFNSNLNPAVIRAAKDLKELNVYLDCLYENEIEKFDCFKIIYKVLPKIQ